MSDFKSAFAAARKAGEKEFTWNGKKYHTRTKEEGAPAKRKMSDDEKRANESYDPIGEMNRQRGWTGTGNAKAESNKARMRPKAPTAGRGTMAGRTADDAYMEPPKRALANDEITDMTYAKGGMVKRGWGKARCK